MQLEHNGLEARQGPVAVTGASGGVGCLAIDMLARRGYEVVALHAQAGRVRHCCAASAPPMCCSCDGARHSARGRWKPERWAGAIDNVGGELLAQLLRSTRMQGQRRRRGPGRRRGA